jgi:hypothetical protein
VEREAAEANLRAKEAIQIPLTVVGVPEERMVQVLQMAAHLVEAASARSRFHEGAALHVGREIRRRRGADREAAAIRGDGRDARAVLAARDRVIDQALFGRDPPDEGEIAFLGLTALEGGLDQRGGLGAAGDDDDAARAAIEAVNRVDVVAEMLAGVIDEREGVVAPAAVNEEARGLGEGDEVIVAVQEEG